MEIPALRDLFWAHRGPVSDKWEQYIPVYESELRPYLARGAPVDLLEIGVQNGGSLEIWHKILPPHSRVVGLDNDEHCRALALSDGIELHIGDATQKAFVDSALGDASFDIIIDDGSHRSSDVIASFDILFSRLKPGGIYIVEDLHCSYSCAHGGGFRAEGSSIEWAKTLVDAVNADHIESASEPPRKDLSRLRAFNAEIARVAFFDSMLVVQKYIEPKRRPFARLLTGAEFVFDPLKWIAAMPDRDLASLMIGPSVAQRLETDFKQRLDELDQQQNELGLRAEELRRQEQALQRQQQEFAIRKRAAMFDHDWYLERYPDVRLAGIDPERHYAEHGASEKRDPNPYFDTDWYLRENPDVLTAGINPLTHYARYGFPEGRAPSPCHADGRQNFREVLKDEFRRHRKDELEAFLSSRQRIALPTVQDPEVSIILVLYNQAELTLAVLRSLERAIDVPAEVIIVDNASDDRTKALCERIDGADIIVNETNLHFLRSVNQAAERARGHALLLLNSDAFVKPGAIALGRDVLRDQKDVGAVGGKVLLLDGALQEAGCIVWQDGSCVGYGRGRKPDEPEFQFRRDVDYCSAALLFIRRSLFEELHGFDEAYAPAYYEETDLCIRLQQMGYRVVYEPRIEATHFEFASATSSEAALALQRKNLVKLQKRHSAWLKDKCLPAGSRQLDARARPRPHGRVLMIDDRVPDPTLGAGYPRANAIIRAMTKAGWFVTLYSITGAPISWESAYRILPHEVEIIKDGGVDGLRKFLSDRVGYYDCVLVSRPHNLDSFRSVVRSVPAFLAGTKLIYDAEAVAARREVLQLAVKGISLTEQEQERRITEETDLAAGAALVLAVSESEAAFYRGTGVPVHVIGHCLTPEPTSASFEIRSDILFVGALDDDNAPNADSLVWFVHNVMPRLDQLLGADYRLKIVGSNRSSSVQALAGPRVELLGRVEDIGVHYNSARLLIAPTRFAAGVPIKVYEAAGAGLPVVATTLVAEQLGWRNGVELLTANSPADFATACHRLYRDPALWQRLRDAALAKVATDCSPDDFDARVAAALAEAKKVDR